jgi:hypothetical protein
LGDIDVEYGVWGEVFEVIVIIFEVKVIRQFIAGLGQPALIDAFIGLRIAPPLTSLMMVPA